MTGQERDRPLGVGDRIELRHGPFLSTWRVAKLLEHGAQLEYVCDVRFIGHRYVTYAPDGTQLTDHPDQAWLGRAHWDAAKRSEAADRAAEDRRTPDGWDTWADREDADVAAMIWVSQRGEAGPHAGLSPGEARSFAARLLELADYAEGSGDGGDLPGGGR